MKTLIFVTIINCLMWIFNPFIDGALCNFYKLHGYEEPVLPYALLTIFYVFMFFYNITLLMKNIIYRMSID